MSQQPTAVEKIDVDVTGGDLARHADDAWHALMARNDPQHPEVMLRGDTLSRLARDEDRVKLEPYAQASMRDRMSRVATFSVLTDRGLREVKPPADVASVLLGRSPHELAQAPRINRVTDVPVFGTDESLLTDPGYHPGARTYYQPFGNEVGSAPSWDAEDEMAGVLDEDVRNARDLLLTELLGDFPFADPASKAHALCLILEPFVREVIGDHPTPLYVVMAPTWGTGKSLLAKTCLSVGCGRVSESPPPSTDENEFRKRLTADMMQAPAAVWFDNVGRRLDSSSLAAALTATRWSDRILGHSRMADVPIRNVWIATMNNPSISGELTRRAVPIFLDAQSDEPWTRFGPKKGNQWKHPLPGWAFEHREQLVYAALTLVASWMHGTHTDIDWAGDEYRPRAAGSRFLGSYERWSKVMGGILAAAGNEHFLDNREKLHAEADTDRDDDAAFLKAWHDREQTPLTLDGILLLLSEPIPTNGGTRLEPIPLPTKLRVRRDDLPKALANWLQWRKGAVNGGYILHNDGKRPRRWHVEKVI